MAELEVILNIPNSQLLTKPWKVIAYDILRPRSMRGFISNVLQMARALGEINRFYSNRLPEKHFIILQKRMTELRKVVKNAERFKKKEIIPWQQLEYMFSGEDRKEMKR